MKINKIIEKESLEWNVAELHKCVVHLQIAIPFSWAPDRRHWSVAIAFAAPASSIEPRPNVWGKLNRSNRSFIQPRSSETRLITKQQQDHGLRTMNKRRIFLPNLKQILEGQSTGFAVHVLSPVQHWMDPISTIWWSKLGEKSMLSKVEQHFRYWRRWKESMVMRETMTLMT